MSQQDIKIKDGIKMYEGNYQYIQSWGLEGSVLYVEFKNGSLYKYLDIDGSTVTLLEIARNFERTFQKYIKGHFEYERVE